ncbi:hypothetical protein Leryth_017638 [Lithospermum erythrorhizon]|nr:hypothetical protein Leryth_017638 [Lithospermum erythrorhizon]
MAQSMIIMFPLVLLLCNAKVWANPENENDAEYPFRQSLKVFPNEARRNLMQNIVTGLSKYMYKRHNFAVTTAPIPAPEITLPPHHAPPLAPAPSHHLDCDGMCKHRCSLHSRQNVCWRACGTCCVRCKCVPPGTSGNRELCGTCYTNMTTHGNRPKCP